MDEPPSYFSIVIFSGQLLLPLLCLAVLIFVGGLIAATEAAFFSLEAEDVDKCRLNNRPQEKAVILLLDNAHTFLVTLLLTNGLVRVGIVTITTVVFWNNPGNKLPAALVIFSTTLVLVLLCEILPKFLGKHYNFAFARAAAGSWKLIFQVLRPLSVTLLQLKRIWKRTLVEKKNSAEEFTQALELAADIEGTSEGEKDILRGIVNFGMLTVRQVMRARTEISSINVESDFEQLMVVVNKSGFSRIPVYRKTIDTIEGVLYIKDLLPFLDHDRSFEWQKLLRPCFFVPEAKKIDLLLKDFQEKRVHMALVIDEYGGTTGLVTLEDLIEEIIGEINDEFDEVDLLFRKIDNNTFVFDGKTSLHDFCKALEIDYSTFSEVRGESESLGGLILELNNELPKTGDQINYEQFTFVIEAVDRKRIKRLRIKVHEQA